MRTTTRLTARTKIGRTCAATSRPIPTRPRSAIVRLGVPRCLHETTLACGWSRSKFGPIRTADGVFARPRCSAQVRWTPRATSSLRTESPVVRDRAASPLDRTAISEELRRLWDALSDDQRKVYDQKADQLRGEMARERLIAARTARDRAVEAALGVRCRTATRA